MIKNVLTQFLFEQNILKTTQTKPIVDAIKNRRKITFDYYGPRIPKKDSVRPGKRIKVEPVAIGLSKRGNLILRAWVEPPSVTKSGFEKGKWRTFMVTRAKNIQITDEIFNTKRPSYKDGNDGSMTVTYVTSDWEKIPRIKKYEKPPEKPKAITKPKEPVKSEPLKPEPEKAKTDVLPQPQPEKKPEELKKPEEPKKPEEKLPQPKPEIKPEKSPEETDKTIKENLKRIKTLMFQ